MMMWRRVTRWLLVLLLGRWSCMLRIVLGWWMLVLVLVLLLVLLVLVLVLVLVLHHLTKDYKLYRSVYVHKQSSKSPTVVHACNHSRYACAEHVHRSATVPFAGVCGLKGGESAWVVT
jgi:uncharacterized protein (DUF58 family)